VPHAFALIKEFIFVNPYSNSLIIIGVAVGIGIGIDLKLLRFLILSIPIAK
jgi:hypothetical protein